MQNIIKYSNRKLYSKNQSRYLNLEEIQYLVLNNIPFVVTEKSTKKDITSEVLAAVVSELVINAGKINAKELKNLIFKANLIDTNSKSNYTNESPISGSSLETTV